MSATCVRVAVVGASGYTGSELTRLLLDHPKVNITGFFSSSSVGEDVGEKIPYFRGRPPLKFQALSNLFQQDDDVVFFATPHGVAMSAAESLLAQNKVVIDLGADFRLQNSTIFNKVYGQHTALSTLKKAVYGLSEVERSKIANANLIACPGCYATAIELTLIPFISTNSLDNDILIDAKSGTSGAGKQTQRSDLLLAEMLTNYKPYAIDGHRHLPEILQTLQNFTKNPLPHLTFIPHLLPTARGIFANFYLTLKNQLCAHTLLSDYWKNEFFVEILPLGKVAEMGSVLHTNRLTISVHPLSDNKIMIAATLDNLLKGAAGQAIQNFNIRFGFPEITGLSGAMLPPQ